MRLPEPYDLQVFKQIVTKAGNGTISTITNQTAAKMAKGAFHEYAAAQGAAASSIGSNLYTESGPWNITIESKK